MLQKKAKPSSKNSRSSGKPRLITLPKLKKKCHETWSQIVRSRDKTCALCDASEKLSAHHFVVNAARSLQLRFDPSNGIALCYAHHIRVVHNEASFAITKKLVDIAIKRGNLTQAKLDSMLATVSDSSLVRRADLDSILARLKDQLEHIRCAAVELDSAKSEV